MQSMSAESIGVKGISVTGDDSTNADAAVDTIGEAIKKVSSQRSALVPFRTDLSIQLLT